MAFRIADILAHPMAYRIWQAPFSDGKLKPLARSGLLDQTGGRVLDVGCGPGTHAMVFAGREYVGIDTERRYVEYAARHFPGTFLQADATSLCAERLGVFDLVFASSMLHHLDDEAVAAVLDGIVGCLKPNGRVCIVDLILPREASVARWLARHDRGPFARPLEAWKEILGRVFITERLEPFTLDLFRLPMWQLFHFEGRVP